MITREDVRRAVGKGAFGLGMGHMGDNGGSPLYRTRLGKQVTNPNPITL